MEQRECAVEALVKPLPSFWAGKRVAVFGHTGFKGAWLSLWLHRLGAAVFGVSLPAEEPSLFTAAGLDSLLDTYHADIRDPDGVASVTSRIQPQISFHLAA